jgi:hypothetical protein
MPQAMTACLKTRRANYNRSHYFLYTARVPDNDRIVQNGG